jgi:hypothetical protein
VRRRIRRICSIDKPVCGISLKVRVDHHGIDSRGQPTNRDARVDVLYSADVAGVAPRRGPVIVGVVATGQWEVVTLRAELIQPTIGESAPGDYRFQHQVVLCLRAWDGRQTLDGQFLANAILQ